MENKSKENRYLRLYNQISNLLEGHPQPVARMATITALLAHKIDYFFWTGFYVLIKDELIVGPYQGPLACIRLENGKGVCWAAIEQQKAIIVPDVEQFPGHIACDSRSKSEIAIPLRNRMEEIIGVLDVDSTQIAAFDEVDQYWLEKIIRLVYH